MVSMRYLPDKYVSTQEEDKVRKKRVETQLIILNIV